MAKSASRLSFHQESVPVNVDCSAKSCAQLDS
jgi:hypothetical protein